MNLTVTIILVHLKFNSKVRIASYLEFLLAKLDHNTKLDKINVVVQAVARQKTQQAVTR